jgi:hypothetical protein
VELFDEIGLKYLQSQKTEVEEEFRKVEVKEFKEEKRCC